MVRTPIPYLGKIRFYWCDQCNVPLIDKSCNICQNEGSQVNISPPGDIRPALKGDLDFIASAVEKQYGSRVKIKFTQLIKNQIIFLNKIPYIDRMDEIIIQGRVLAVFRYNLIKESFEILPKITLASFLWEPESKGWINVDQGAKTPILNGASVLRPGVNFADKEISYDDPVIVICGEEVIAVGLAKMTGIEMMSREKGVAVKTKYKKKGKLDQLAPLELSWEKILKANEHSLNKKESTAINFIEDASTGFQNKVIAYSGGKDSLVTLNLVAQSDITYDIIFSDTKLEFPETISNIKKISQVYQRPVHQFKNIRWDFWERFDKFGPPTRNTRWCCKSAKLLPVNEILESLYPDEKKVLTFIGRRRYESFGRSREPLISQNPWIPKQITAAPIHNWNAFEIYLYLYKYKLFSLLNPLYESGFIRIGCWVCPASSMADFHIMKTTHPDLIQKLFSNLHMIKNREKFPIEFISWGLWRWKNIPQKVKNFLNYQKIEYTGQFLNQKDGDHLRFILTSYPSPCVEGGFSTFISSNQMFELKYLEHLLPILGNVNYNEELDIISIYLEKNVRVDIFSDGSVILKGNTLESINEAIDPVIRTIYRKICCDGCGICLHHCNEHALYLESESIQVNMETCIKCLQCNKFCPLIRYQADSDFLSSIPNS
ncbi:phosphoadenosine phosphosulfate reductase domain-containing protein [Candidatus Hodarchaeum mangrovi]